MLGSGYTEHQEALRPVRRDQNREKVHHMPAASLAWPAACCTE